MRTFVVLLVLLTQGRAGAASPFAQWHAGVDARTSLNHRPVGLAVGVRRERLGLEVVVDPLGLMRDSLMMDLQLAFWPSIEAWEITLGWRHESEVVGAGRRHDERAVFGANVVVPHTSSFRLKFGAEVVVSLVRHGGGLRSDVLPMSAADIALGAELLFHLRCDFTGRL
jgi:hypothetical protein